MHAASLFDVFLVDAATFANARIAQEIFERRLARRAVSSQVSYATQVTQLCENLSFSQVDAHPEEGPLLGRPLHVLVGHTHARHASHLPGARQPGQCAHLLLLSHSS